MSRSYGSRLPHRLARDVLKYRDRIIEIAAGEYDDNVENLLLRIGGPASFNSLRTRDKVTFLRFADVLSELRKLCPQASYHSCKSVLAQFDGFRCTISTPKNRRSRSTYVPGRTRSFLLCFERRGSSRRTPNAALQSALLRCFDEIFSKVREQNRASDDGRQHYLYTSRGVLYSY